MRLINLFEALEGKWLTADEVRGKPDLAQQEAFRQINHAWNEYKKRSDELKKTTEDALINAGFNPKEFPNSKAEQDRYFETLEATGISMATYDDAKAEIANGLPAVVIGREKHPESKPGEPIRINISGALFAIDMMWPHYETGWNKEAKDWKPTTPNAKPIQQVEKEFGSDTPTPVAPEFGSDTPTKSDNEFGSDTPTKSDNEFGSDTPTNKNTPGISSYDWKKI